MIKLDIVNRVADKTGVPRAKAEVMVEALFEAMKEALQRSERIELRGFGVFVVKPRKKGKKPGRTVKVPPNRGTVDPREVERVVKELASQRSGR
jgi:DNA-binding protein HU-beta